MSRLTEFIEKMEEQSCYHIPLCKEDGICKEESCPISKAIEAIKELQHYKDLEEQGRLIIGHKDPVGEQGPEGKGRWIDNHCSICGITPLGEEIWTHLDLDPPRFELYMNYCPNCGAKMDEVENE